MLRLMSSDLVLDEVDDYDLDDLPAEVRDQMKFNLVEVLGEVLAVTLRGASLQEGRILFSETAAS